MDRLAWIGCRRKLARSVSTLLIGIVASFAIVSSLQAQTNDTAVVPPAPALLDADRAPNVMDLAQRVSELEKALNNRQTSEKRPAPATDTLPKSVWADDSHKKWTVKVGGHVQLDYANWADADSAITGPAAAPGTKDYFEFRRLRLTADGKGYGNLDFRLQMSLEPETVSESGGTATSPEVKDAYLSVNDIPWLGRFRIGHFFVPFSLEQVTNDTFNLFLERSIPVNGVFAADREVGVAFYNATSDQNVTWSYGLFFDSISETLKERIDDNQGYRLVGRVTWLPYYDEESDGRHLVHLGAGVLYTDDQNNSVRFRTRPQIHEGPRLIDSGVLDASNFMTGNVEFAVVWGPVTVQSEAFLSRVNLSASDAATIGGAYAHLSYFLTGEHRVYERFGQHGAQFGRNVPKTNFLLTHDGCGWGAWEAKARWSYLDLSEVNAGQYNDLTIGLNWYWSDRTRVMFDWIHPFTSSQTTFGETSSDLLAMRFDFNW